MALTVESLERAEEEIHEEWQRRFEQRALKGPYRDGAFHPPTFLQQPIRIVFLMKEVNADREVNAWALRDVVGSGDHGTTWNLVCYWADGILQGGAGWRELPDATKAYRKATLDKAAVVNVNKGVGGPVADNDFLWTCAVADGDLLRRQILIYDPHLVVACGTGAITEAAVFNAPWQSWQKPERGCRWLRPGETWPIIADCHHPNARLRHSALHADLLDGLRHAGLFELPTPPS